MPDGWEYYAAASPYAGIGFCATLGKGGAAAVAGLLAGGVAGGIVYISMKDAPKEQKILWALVSGLLTGGAAAAMAYFYCKGTEVGAPVRVMR